MACTDTSESSPRYERAFVMFSFRNAVESGVCWWLVSLAVRSTQLFARVQLIACCRNR